jgi:drug/metabolite transporter (DMT)-like permease
LLHEPFTPLIVLGSAMTIAGVFIVLRRADLRSVPIAKGA